MTQRYKVKGAWINDPFVTFVEEDMVFATDYDALQRVAEEMAAALEKVMKEWVNGRLVADGITLTTRERAEAALSAYQRHRGEQ